MRNGLSVFLAFLAPVVLVTSFISSLANAVPPKQRLILLPIGYYTPETSAALGGLAIYNIDKKTEGRMSNILTSFSYTLKQQSIFILNPKYYLDNGNLELFGNMNYLFFPSEFYGRGNETRVEDLEHFTQNIFTLEGGFKYKFYQDFYFSPSGNFQKQKIVSHEYGKKVDQEIKLGFGEYVEQSVAIQLGYDSRDYVNAPLSGTYYFTSASKHWFDNPDGRIDDHDYDGTEFDFRKYLRMGEKEVLAFKFFLSKEEGNSIPFQYLDKLGGANALRGYLSGRFRDKSIGIVQAEYRKDFSERFAWAVFTGMGTVAPDFYTLTKNRRRHVLGGGIHYIADTESRQKFRIDLGLGEEGNYGVYVIFGEAF